MRSFAKTLALKTGALKRFQTAQDDAQPVANTNPATTRENATSAVLEGNTDALHWPITWMQSEIDSLTKRITELEKNEACRPFIHIEIKPVEGASEGQQYAPFIKTAHA